MPQNNAFDTQSYKNSICTRLDTVLDDIYNHQKQTEKDKCIKTA